MNGNTHHAVTRVAIVTGASKGIGRDIALRLADDGLDVTINSRNAAELEVVAEEIRAKGRKALAFVGDVSDEEVVQSMVEKTVEVLGRLDVMVANAGTAVVSRVVDMSLKDWNYCMDSNLASVMLCYKYAARQMIKQGEGGRILGASSILGKKGGPEVSAYVATKFAIRGLTQCLAIELAPHKITANTYAPGVILTPLSKRDGPRCSDRLTGTNSEYRCPRQAIRWDPWGVHEACLRHSTGRPPLIGRHRRQSGVISGEARGLFYHRANNCHGRRRCHELVEGSDRCPQATVTLIILVSYHNTGCPNHSYYTSISSLANNKYGRCVDNGRTSCLKGHFQRRLILAVTV